MIESMTNESTPGENGAEPISLEIWENHLKQVEEVREMIRGDVSWDSKRSDSMHHILRNLEGGLLLSQYLKSKNKIPTVAEFKKLTAVEDIKKYYSLTQEFPEFGDKEMNSKEGYFPGLWQTIAGSANIVDEYEKRLREGVQG